MAGVGQRELFVAATLFVIIGAGVAAAAAGLSMALGAFVAGLLLAETEFRKAIETAIGPFKGLLLGLFFFSIGMTIDPGAVVRAPMALALGVAGLILGKGAILYLLGRLFRLPRLAAVELGLLLGPAGEFAFVGIGLAASLGLIGRGIAGVALTVTAVTMALIPVLAAVAARMRARAEADRPLDPDLAVRPQGGTGHAIVIGNGRVGQVVSDLLDRHGMAHVTVDNNPRSVLTERRQGREVYFGDAIDAEFLTQCGSGRGAGGDHHRSAGCGGDRGSGAADPRPAAGCGDRGAGARRRSGAQALCLGRDRRRAGNHRGQPATVGSSASGHGTGGGAGHRQHP